MVFDTARNRAYLRALEKVVTSRSRVMDLGAGLGVHGLYAASLGADSVCLVEPSPVIEIARQIALDNGLDNISCFPCRVEDLELDGAVDVLVSVFTGNFLLTEDLLPSLFLARDRFLAPDGVMIPDRAVMLVAPVMAEDYYEEQLNAWLEGAPRVAGKDAPELNFEAARSYAVNTAYSVKSERLGGTRLAEPVQLMELDFRQADRAECDHQVDLELARDGTCHGWLGWFRMCLVDEWYCTAGEDGPTHWSPVFLPLAQPVQVTSGERLRFALKRPEFGDWTWTTEHNGRCQRQSTFLSSPVTPARLLKASDTYRPALNARGEAASWLLAQMAGRQSVGELADALFDRYPGAFSGKGDALNFVRQLGGQLS
jgi:hypothetical protein